MKKSLTKKEIKSLYDCLFAHRTEYIADFLFNQGFKKSGKKSEVEARLKEAVNNKSIDHAELIALLDDIEGWGNQHIFFMKANQSSTAKWRDEKYVKTVLKKNRCIGLFNNMKPLFLPDKMKLSTIEWSNQRVRFVWVEKRSWEERISEEDRTLKSGLILKGYMPREERGILAFDWNLLSGNCFLLIQRLPRGTKYNEAASKIWNEMKNFIDPNNFKMIPLGKAIKKIDASKETKTRRIDHETIQGAKINHTSKNRKRDANKDPQIIKSKKAIGKAINNYGNFYWTANGTTLPSDFHTTIYPKSGRVGIFGQKTEEEVMYVLGRIMHFTK